MSNLAILPVWKKGASAEDWFYDMAVQARVHPERFNKMVLAYQEEAGPGRTTSSYYCHNAQTTELLGMLELAKNDVVRFTSG